MHNATHKSPESVTGTPSLAATITDKRGFADHWKFSVRKVDGLLASGLPHFKCGSRRVRINVAEADLWMREQFATQRRGTSQVVCGGNSK